jgi:Trk K+ transport system NAD-binding subunit
VVTVLALLIVVASIVLRFDYRPGHGGRLSMSQSIYFAIETVATVGYGDFSFAAQSPGLRAFGIVLIVLGVLLVSTTFALLTNVLVSRRLEASLGRQQATAMRGHVVLIGLGSVGVRVLEGLLEQGREVVVLERDENNRYLGQARALGVPVIIADATLRPTLQAVNVPLASAVAVLTSDDLTNIETGLAVREALGDRWESVPLVLRVFDRQLARTVEQSFGFRHVRSASVLASPWFVGAALGLDVLATFEVNRTPFLVGRLTIARGGGLEGLAMQDLSARTRVVAIGREVGGVEYPPRRGTRFAGGDQAYLIGPYDELLAVLRRDQGVSAAP